MPYEPSAPLSFPVECVTSPGGVAAFVLLAALPLAVVLTWLTVVLYRWQVARVMHRVSAEGRHDVRTPPRSVGSPPAAELRVEIIGSEATPTPSPLEWRSARGVRIAGLAYAAAGLVHALVATALTFTLGEIEPLPVRVLSVWLLYAWPVIPTLLLTSVNDTRAKWALVIGYFVVVLAVDLTLSALALREPGGGTLTQVWLIWMGPPSVLLWLLSNRAWRSVGLLAYLIAIALIAGWLLATQGLGCLALALNDVDLWLHYRWFVLVALVGTLLGGAWWVLRRIATAYRDKRLSDQSLTLDSWWLVVTLIDMVIQLDATQGASASFVLAFLAYRWLAGRLQGPPTPDTRPASLLLLRVFGHRRRSRRLLDQLGQRWRYLGPISLIGAPDLAATNLEPDELLQFWCLRLRGLFVASKEDLRDRLERFDARPDPDGRYRVNEFFCYDNTWRATVHALARRSDVVLMDLRGFGKNNRGCEFELGLLLSEVPLAKVVLLTDETTDTGQLTELLQTLWSRLPRESVNRALPQPTLRRYHVAGALHSARRLLSALTATDPG